MQNQVVQEFASVNQEATEFWQMFGSEPSVINGNDKSGVTFAYQI